MTEDMDDAAHDTYAAYAPHDSLEGLLQRGRGLGAQRAAQSPPAAAAFVYDGIRREWRWDRQCDHRAVYHARLVRDLALPLAPITAQLDGDGGDAVDADDAGDPAGTAERAEDACARATSVLELLALDGDTEARAALRAHVREGAHWIAVLESVAGLWPAAWWEDLADVARARILDEDEDEPWTDSEPWTRFGLKAPSPRPPWEADPRPDAALLAVLADADAGATQKAHALRHLALHRGPQPDLIPLVPSLGTPDGRRAMPLVQRAVRRLGALAVPAARGWLTDEREWLSRLGEQVMADHRGPEAIPELVAELCAQWEAQAWCGPDQEAGRLARFGPAAAEAVPVLRTYWSRTPHSYERAVYLEALAAIDPTGDGMDQVYAESLWDCEERARLIGIASAPARPELLDRIAALRDDPIEAAEVRDAARARLDPAARP